MKRYNNNIKRAVAAFLAALLSLGAFAPACFAEEIATLAPMPTAPSLAFASDLLPGQQFDVWRSNADGKLYLYLPYGVDREALKPCFDAPSASANGKALSPDSVTDVFASADTVDFELGDEKFAVTLLPASKLPTVFITTESGSLDAIHADKSHKEKGEMTVFDGSDSSASSYALSYIKGRGNTTWTSSWKKPYNIKLDKKAGLLGMGEAKKWCLIANALDDTRLRNAVALTVARNTRIPYTIDFRFVDVFINGGYRGNYMLTEKVEVGGNRVDINDLDKENEKLCGDVDPDSLEPIVSDDMMFRIYEDQAGPILTSYIPLPAEPDNVSGGYLLEFDYRFSSNTEDLRSGFCSERRSGIVLKSPENAGKREIDYISGEYQKLEDALFSPDGVNSEGQHYTELLDMPSMTDAYLLMEFSLDGDAGFYSWFMYKEKDDPLFYAGPAWDFDQAFGTDYGMFGAKRYYLTHKPDSEKTKEELEDTFVHGSPYRLLPGFDDFIGLAAERWKELSVWVKTDLTEQMEALTEELADSIVSDAMRWDSSTYDSFMNINGRSPEEKRENWLQNVGEMLGAFPSRADNMLSELSDTDLMTSNYIERTKKQKIGKFFYNHGAKIVVAAVVLVAGAVAAAVIVKKKRGKAAKKAKARRK